MQAFEYASPTTLAEAFALLGSSADDAQILAGGTDQISLMKDYIHTPKRVVNIKSIRELGGIAHARGGLRIGAAVTFDELMNETDWDAYGVPSGNPKCANCMVSCGYEPTAVMEGFGSIKGIFAMARGWFGLYPDAGALKLLDEPVAAASPLVQIAASEKEQETAQV